MDGTVEIGEAAIDLGRVPVEDDLEAQPLGTEDLGLVPVGQRQLALVGKLLGEHYDRGSLSSVETLQALDGIMRERVANSGDTRPDTAGHFLGDPYLRARVVDRPLWPIASLDHHVLAPAPAAKEEERTPAQLTDYERRGLGQRLNLADGHAYQGIDSLFPGEFWDLDALWEECERTSIPEMEHRFRNAFATLAGSPAMASSERFRICPTASNSIDIVAAVAAARGLHVLLIEPTFDNLALIMRRRGVGLSALPEPDLIAALGAGTVGELIADAPGDAVFLVQPNNPTGHTLDEASFRAIAEATAAASKVLLLDFTFRFYNRRPFDQYAILAEAGVSFVAFEDTGKVWPTHDLKASLLFASPDLAPLVNEVYDEVYLAHSRFALSILERCILETSRVGLGTTIWRQVDDRRRLVRESIASTPLTVSADATWSDLPVEWLDCAATGLDDEAVTEVLRVRGIHVLPGRHFFWHSNDRPEQHRNIRIAMMKPLASFMEALTLLRGYDGSPT